MKRLGLILVSVALMLGMAQCKKNVEPIATTTSGTMNISLDVDGGSKVSVTPSTGVVKFQTGDKIYVASHGKYVGTLTHNGSNFSGTISGATADEPLYFYFMGNKTSTGTLTAGTTASIAVSIYDQTEGYPVISAAPSNENFSTSTYTYTATLLNKCALVKFNVTTSSSAPTIITGVNDVVTVTFSDSGVGTFVSSQSKGAIKLAANEATGVAEERWAILIGDQSNVAANGAAYSDDLFYKGTRGAISGITNNGYLDSGITVTVSTAMPKFSVSEDTQVRFAKGNLQYIGSAETPYWKFADSQYEYFGITTGQNSASATVDRDLFGWGTSGYNGRYPYLTHDNNSVYGYGNTDIAGTNYDWGVYNAISNGGNQAGLWRTLTKDEWVYVISDRTGCSTINGIENARYSKATVAGVFGVMIFPDSFTWPSGVSVPTANAINQTGDYTAGSYTADAWTALEAVGVVFLPASGYRSLASLYQMGSTCNYTSSTIFSNVNSNYCFSASASSLNSAGGHSRNTGISVRLVSAGE